MGLMSLKYLGYVALFAMSDLALCTKTPIRYCKQSEAIREVLCFRDFCHR